MAKYRHRLFEMYEFRDEAIRALTPKSARSVTETTEPESWTFAHLVVSHSEGVTLVQFQGARAFDEHTTNALREDFSRLADRLQRDSKVLLDFVEVQSFCAAAIDELVLFHQKLRTKGSRFALCRLDPPVRESFFRKTNPHEKRQ